MAAALAGNPIAQRVGRNYAMNAARQAGSRVKSGAVEIKLYIKENPTSLKIALFVASFLLAFFSILGLINVFNIFSPAQLLINFYNMIFAIVIMVLEGKDNWLGGLQTTIFKKAAFLASPLGKGFFILYVGTMIFCVDLEDQTEFWKIAYIILGITFCGLGLIQLQQHICPTCCGGSPNAHQQFNDDAAAPGTGGNAAGTGAGGPAARV